MKIKTLSTTDARARLGDIVSEVHASGIGVVIGKRDMPLAVLVPFPNEYNKNLSEITNLNAYSKSFDFLADEPELYSKKDLKKGHV